MALCLLLSFLAWKATARAGRRLRVVLLIIGLGWAGRQVKNYRNYAAGLIEPVEIETTIEYQAATWLEENLPGRRVVVPGSVSFRLNAFSDNPQLGGGYDQGISNPQVLAVQHVLFVIEDQVDLSLQWLRSFGIDAIMAGDSGSREFLKPYREPKKFDGVLAEIWPNGGDVIYEVLRRSASLAHVILPEHRVERTPRDALDVEPIEQFVAALENKALPVADFQWLSLTRCGSLPGFNESTILRFRSATIRVGGLG